MMSSPQPPPGRKGRKASKAARPKIFISHSSTDKVFVNRLIRELRDAGVPDPWYDTFNLDGATENISLALTAGINTAEWFVLILSPAAAKSQWVTYEVKAAEQAGASTVVLLHDSPDGHIPYLSNPNLASILHGGQRKIIDFTNDFERALTDLLLVVTPAIGLEYDTRLTISQIIDDDDPDRAERAISSAALSSERFLLPLLERVPDMSGDRKLQYRIKAAMAALGQPAAGPLLALVLRQVELPPKAQAPPPAIAPASVDESGTALYQDDGAIAMIRHILFTGGDRKWAAQVGAGDCLAALANQDHTLRREIYRELRGALVTATNTIAEQSGTGEATYEFYDLLRIAIDTIAQVAAPGELDDFLVYQFMTNYLWGWQSEHAKYKLGYYVIKALSTSGSDEALDYLKQILIDPEFIREYRSQGYHPVERAFVPFGPRAADHLLKLQESANESMLTAIYLNLAQIRHRHGLAAALKWTAKEADDHLDASKILLHVAKTGHPAVCDKLLTYYMKGAFSRFADGPFSDELDEAAVIAARNAEDQAVAARVCRTLADTDDVGLQAELSRTIPAIGAYKLYDVVLEFFADSPNDKVRATAAVSLSEHKILKTPKGINEELKYGPRGEWAPLFAVALSYFDQPEAVAPLVRGLNASFLEEKAALHELYATALARIDSDAAREAHRKWYQRI